MEKMLSFDERRAIQLEMLHALHDACEQYNLTYYLSYGTLLGAVRHQGFIPWDDDLDVMIPYQDFLKLSECFKSDKYTIVSCFNSNEHPYAFGRLCANNTYSKIGRYKTWGLGIDLYIIMGLPDSTIEQKFIMAEVNRLIKKRKLYIRWRFYLIKLGFWFKNNLGVKAIAKSSHEEIALFEKYNYIETKMAHVLAGGDAITPCYLLTGKELLKFEDGMFFAPSRNKELLELWYGDYMQLPPEEDRHPYHSSNIYWK